jgi:transketolase
MATLIAVRRAYGEALADLGAVNQKVVALSADVSNSDYSYLFQERFPDRFFNTGIAEPCLVDVAAGFARMGKIPFVNTFAFLFELRALEQVRTSVCFTKDNVKLAATYAGVSDSFDGPTHHSITDIAIMRALPNMTVVVVADAVEAKQAVPAVAGYPGPVYLRLSRAELPVIFGPEHPFKIGQAVLLRPGNDVTLIGTGVMVGRCLEAADALAQQGVHARVLEMHTIKPLDVETVVAAARETGAIVTAEEHSLIGGLGGAVLEALAETHPVPVVRVGIHDRFTETGPYFPMLDRLGLGVADVVAAAHKAVGLRG